MTSTPIHAQLAPATDEPVSTAVPQTRRILLSGTLLVATALTTVVAIRIWGIHHPFASSDEVAMAYLVRHSYGLTWILAHDYGPVLPFVQRGFAEILSRLGFPIGETAARLPVLIVSLLQIAMTFPLLRRMRCLRREALVGMLCCGLLPTLIADAHYAWAYRAMWLLTGTIALWATLAWLDDRRVWQLAVAGIALLAHCLSNCYAFALPMTVGTVWLWAWRDRRRKDAHPRRPAGAAPWVGFVAPCVLAIAYLAIIWQWTGHAQGQLSHLLNKAEGGTTAWAPPQWTLWRDLWIGQMGYAFAPLAAMGLVAGVGLMLRKRRVALLAMWGLLSAAPLVLAVSPATIGHPGAYLIAAVYTASLLGGLLLCWAYAITRRWPMVRRGVVVLGALALAHMGAGGVDTCLAGGHLVRWTGVTVDWATLQPDTGIKAAGGYVREHVPLDAVVMTLHTNRGMEVPVAEYYLGRAVLASYDLAPEMLAPLVRRMRDHVDIIIAAEEHAYLLTAEADFRRVCTLTRRGEPVRHIFARPAWSLPAASIDVESANTRYDQACSPRQVPMPLPAPDGFTEKLRTYQRVVRALKHMQLASAGARGL